MATADAAAADTATAPAAGADHTEHTEHTEHAGHAEHADRTHPARRGGAPATPRRAGWLPGRLPSWLRHPATPPLATLAAGLAGAAYLWQTDPHQGGQLLPRCPFNWVTGLLCPACGGTRMAYDALHGDWSAALHDNAALLLLGAPLAGWLGWRWLSEGLRGRRYRVRLNRRAAAAVLGVAVGWAVLRNLVG